MTLIRTPTDIPASEITPEAIYHQRRTLMKLALAAGASAFIPDVFAAALSGAALQYNKATAAFTASDALTPLKDVTSWNNFYELGFEKSDPAENADKLQTANWKLAIDGAVDKPGTYTLEDILKPHTLEERIYRLRCVEAWSMVIPWIGIPLADVLQRFNPTSSAKYVAFESIDDPAHLPGQKPTLGGLDWPYVEGLRIDEAMHPLTILAVGLYGKVLPNQNGAPLRLIVPWKYGFKSIKSIVRIHLQDTAPKTTWNKMAPQEYGFYANVNPEVDHPRWSQKTERRLPGSVFNPNRVTTQMFNGYGEQVAGLYRGMDLKRDF